jgi:hypothetical protein
MIQEDLIKLVSTSDDIENLKKLGAELTEKYKQAGGGGDKYALINRRMSKGGGCGCGLNKMFRMSGGALPQSGGALPQSGGVLPQSGGACPCQMQIQGGGSGRRRTLKVRKSKKRSAPRKRDKTMRKTMRKTTK